jgi:serine/threonine-protein kinase
MTTCPSCLIEIEADAVFCGHCGARVRASRRRQTLVGRELDGRFHVEAKIAEGGFGSIYRATHLGSGHVIALKVLHAELAADANLAARFRREGEMLSMLRSPHTVSVFELGETDDGTLYIAMELLRGESLLDRFRKRGPLPWRSVLDMMTGVCRSLGEAHALGIVHRDLKPGNIHLEVGDQAKVIDFGIAKLMRGSDVDDGEDLTRVGQAVGTLEYMAPEQLIGGTCDGRADIYALGVVVYEMLTGRRPYADATGPTSLVAAVMTQPLVAPSRLYPPGAIPLEVDVLVLRCLAKDPKDRYNNVAELISEIEAIPTLARGSWSTELADEESTWIDSKLPSITPVPSPVIITPAGETIMQLDGGAAFAPTHVQPAITDPDIVTPSRAIARGSTSPVNTFGRARRESDLQLKPAPFAEGSRVRPRPTPQPDAAGSNAAVDDTLPVETAPAQAMLERKPLGWKRVAAWTVALLAGGAAVGMAIASLIS